MVVCGPAAGAAPGCCCCSCCCLAGRGAEVAVPIVAPAGATCGASGAAAAAVAAVARLADKPSGRVQTLAYSINPRLRSRYLKYDLYDLYVKIILYTSAYVSIAFGF